ncbi:MAG: hypothetical protein EXR77_16845 [Myxococcales bacterium]|nr:hypothetical protein [Myxococcales bacterium]
MDGQFLAAADGMTQAHAVVRLRDAEAGVAVTNAHHATLAAVQQDRKALLFGRLFANTLTVMLRKHLGRLVDAAKELVLVLQEPLTPAPLATAHLAPLQAASANGSVALDDRKKAEAAADTNRAAREVWIASANAGLRTVEAELQKFAVASGRPQQWVDSFFAPPKAAAAKPKVA